MTAMDDLKIAVASKLMTIEKIVERYGLPGIRLLTLYARDPDNPEMYLHISNDPDMHHLVWRPGSEIPDPDKGWVLAVFQPSRRGDYQAPAYYELATYDRVDSRWRSKFMSLRAGEVEVVKWAYLPSIGAGNE